MRYHLLIIAYIGSSLCCQAQDGFVEGKPRLAYWQARSEKKPVVIVLHGGPAVHHQYLRPEFDALQRSATVIYYDQRGCGKSDTANSYTWQDHVSDLKRVIQLVAGQKKIFLAGSSWGSFLAMLYAYSYPDDIQGLILSGTVQWFGKGEPYKRTKFYPSKLLKQSMHEHRVLPNLSVQDQTKPSTILVTKEYELNSGTTQEEPLASMRSAPTADHLTEIRVPTLLLTGSESIDRQSGYRYDWVDHYTQLLPAVSLHIVDRAGHDPWLSNPDLFFSLSNEFIERNSN